MTLVPEISENLAAAASALWLGTEHLAALGDEQYGLFPASGYDLAKAG